jgi:hypothetical protein
VAEAPRPQNLDRQVRKSLPSHSSALESRDSRLVASTRTPSSRHPNRFTLPPLPRSQQEEDEDRYIALLEAKLTSGKVSKSGGGYLKDFENDGLGGE